MWRSLRQTQETSRHCVTEVGDQGLSTRLWLWEWPRTEAGGPQGARQEKAGLPGQTGGRNMDGKRVAGEDLEGREERIPEHRRKADPYQIVAGNRTEQRSTVGWKPELVSGFSCGDFPVKRERRDLPGCSQEGPEGNPSCGRDS